MTKDVETAQHGSNAIASFEKDPRRAALVDNLEPVAVSAKSWIAIFVSP